MTYTVIRPANHYPSRLVHMTGAEIVKLVTPRRAPARIGEYLVTLPGGEVWRSKALHADGIEHFFYGLEGAAAVEVTGPAATYALGPGRWAYVPPGRGFRLAGSDDPQTSRILWLKRRFEPGPGMGAPPAAAGDREDEPFEPTAVAGLRRRELLPPDDESFDFNMSLLAFDPGTDLGKIEIHDEEHGLYMTAGGGVYELDGTAHPVEAGDFIYMAPYCPQGFTAGAAGAEYLLYKDVYRDGF